TRQLHLGVSASPGGPAETGAAGPSRPQGAARGRLIRAIRSKSRPLTGDAGSTPIPDPPHRGGRARMGARRRPWAMAEAPEIQIAPRAVVEAGARPVPLEMERALDVIDALEFPSEVGTGSHEALDLPDPVRC